MFLNLWLTLYINQIAMPVKRCLFWYC